MPNLSGFLDFQAYSTAASLLPCLLGVIYFFAYGALIFQIKGLIGSNGILPLSQFLQLASKAFGSKKYYHLPTLFWFNSSNKALITLLIGGIVCSIFLMLNFSPPLFLALLFLIQLSILAVGQDFLAFGWEQFLLEITFNAFFLSLFPIPNPLIWISLNLLLFRFYFQAGISKILSKDQTWKTLSALKYHYQTQPIPNTIAWYAHQMPFWFHKLSAAVMFLIEILVPFGIFGPAEVRLITFILFFSLQFFIWFTGNFSYLNYLTLFFSVILISNPYFELIHIQILINEVPSMPLQNSLIDLVGGALILFQCISLRHYLKPHPTLKKMLDWIAPFHIVNRYGIFAVMTTKRLEVVIEGSSDGVHWDEYLFKFKPSEIDRRPRRVSPYQPRLDWMAWFLAFKKFENQLWFQRFLIHLLIGTPCVLKLLRYNPFQEKPPRYIRALLYEYEFTDSKTKQKTGCWWQRKLIGSYSPNLQLQVNSPNAPTKA